MSHTMRSMITKPNLKVLSWEPYLYSTYYRIMFKN